MKVLVINCGSSSLKYQLIDMEGEKVLCKGLCERIGMESSMITHEANGHKATTPAIFPTHTEAFAEVVKKMTTGAGKCINDVSEIDAIGHRVVHGGEKFKSSCLITDEVINTLRELSPLAPLHNPAGILGIEAARKVLMTSSVIRQLLLNFSPPCTTRWPMASISLTSLMHLPAPVVIFFTTSAKASVWVGKIAGVVALVPLAS